MAAFLINIIGAGRLGKTLGHLFVKHQSVKVQAVCNQTQISAAEAIKFIGQGYYCPAIYDLQSADITFITTPDDKISLIAQELSENRGLKSGDIILHCSGLLSSDALAAVKAKGCYVASVHPMTSFAEPALSILRYENTHCAIEGDEEVIPILCALFNSIGSISYEIKKEKKAVYHAAGVFASNYLVTLAQQSLLCMKNAGIDEKMSMQIITRLMKDTVFNLECTSSLEQTLTGPIKRGDVSTIKEHLAVLTDKEQKNLYALLAKITLNLTHHDKAKKEAIEKCLS